MTSYGQIYGLSLWGVTSSLLLALVGGFFRPLKWFYHWPVYFPPDKKKNDPFFPFAYRMAGNTLFFFPFLLLVSSVHFHKRQWELLFFSVERLTPSLQSLRMSTFSSSPHPESEGISVPLSSKWRNFPSSSPSYSLLPEFENGKPSPFLLRPSPSLLALGITGKNLHLHLARWTYSPFPSGSQCRHPLGPATWGGTPPLPFFPPLPFPFSLRNYFQTLPAFSIFLLLRVFFFFCTVSNQFPLALIENEMSSPPPFFFPFLGLSGCTTLPLVLSDGCFPPFFFSCFSMVPVFRFPFLKANSDRRWFLLFLFPLSLRMDKRDPVFWPHTIKFFHVSFFFLSSD